MAKVMICADCHSYGYLIIAGEKKPGFFTKQEGRQQVKEFKDTGDINKVEADQLIDQINQDPHFPENIIIDLKAMIAHAWGERLGVKTIQTLVSVVEQVLNTATAEEDDNPPDPPQADNNKRTYMN